MKKAAAFLLVGILILISLTACVAGGSAEQQAEQPASVPESGVSQQPENDADKDNQDRCRSSVLAPIRSITIPA